MKIKDNFIKILVVLVTLVCAVLLIIFAGPAVVRAAIYLFGLFSPFIFGYLISRLINPLADFLQRRLKIPRGGSAAMVVILTFAAMVAIIGGVGYKFFDEMRNLYRQWPEISQSLSSAWDNFISKWNRLYIELPDSVQNMLDNMSDSLSQQVSRFMTNIEVVDNAQNFAKALPRGIIWTIVFVIDMFFMVSRKEEIDRAIHKLLGDRIIRKASEIRNEFKVYLWGYVRAQAILMVIIFILISLVLTALGAPYALLVAILTAFLDALPFFGSGITLFPLAVIYFIDGNIKLGIGYIAVYFGVVLVRRFIEPKLVSDKMGFNPILTLMSMYIGYKWWGIIGMLIGPILLMVIISLYKVGLFSGIIHIFKRLWNFAVHEVRIFIEYLNNLTK